MKWLAIINKSWRAVRYHDLGYDISAPEDFPLQKVEEIIKSLPKAKWYIKIEKSMSAIIKCPVSQQNLFLNMILI